MDDADGRDESLGHDSHEWLARGDEMPGGDPWSCAGLIQYSPGGRLGFDDRGEGAWLLMVRGVGSWGRCVALEEGRLVSGGVRCEVIVVGAKTCEMVCYACGLGLDSLDSRLCQCL